MWLSVSCLCVCVCVQSSDEVLDKLEEPEVLEEEDEEIKEDIGTYIPSSVVACVHYTITTFLADPYVAHYQRLLTEEEVSQLHQRQDGTNSHSKTTVSHPLSISSPSPSVLFSSDTTHWRCSVETHSLLHPALSFTLYQTCVITGNACESFVDTCVRTCVSAYIYRCVKGCVNIGSHLGNRKVCVCVCMCKCVCVYTCVCHWCLCCLSIKETFTFLQSHLFPIINNYQVCYCHFLMLLQNGSKSFVVCLYICCRMCCSVKEHLLTGKRRDTSMCFMLSTMSLSMCLHLLLLILFRCLFFQRQRTRVLKHNSQLQAAMKDGRQLRWCLSFLFLTAIFHVYCSDLRDQGITRPKVLILLPFREAALRTVNIMIQLLGKVCLCLRGQTCTVMCCVFPSVKWPITSDF